MRGLSMNEFVITGSKSITIRSTLYCKFELAFNIIFAPLAIMMKLYEDMRAQDLMLNYRGYKYLI